MSSPRLNLEDALRLYEIVGAHIPKDIADDESVLNFVGKIVNSIVEANEHGRYIEAIALMTGQASHDLLDLPLEELLMLFMEGIIANHIVLLCHFCREIGYDRPAR